MATALGLAVILAVCLSGGLSPRPAPRYAVTDLGVLPGATLSHASGINSRGDVVGLSGTERRHLQHAFLYHNGTLTDLGRFRLIGSHDGPAINDKGQIAGVMDAANAPGFRYRLHACLYGAGGTHNLGTPPGCTMSLGEAINARGQIAVSAWGSRAGEFTHHSFLYDGGRMTDIGGLPGGGDVLPTGLNDAGQVVGYCDLGGNLRAFVYDSRTQQMTALATPPGMDSYASGLNDRGQIIGLAGVRRKPSQAVVWEGGRMTILGTLPGRTDVSGDAINNRGEAVGEAGSRASRLSDFAYDHRLNLGPLLPLFQKQWTQHAFVYRDGKMQDLNALIPARSGWTLESATGINDRGQIVGRGLHHGQERAFLLTPR